MKFIKDSRFKINISLFLSKSCCKRIRSNNFIGPKNFATLLICREIALCILTLKKKHRPIYFVNCKHPAIYWSGH